MTYLMRSGTLWGENGTVPLAKITGTLHSSKKTVTLSQTGETFTCSIQQTAYDASRQYVMCREDGSPFLTGRPLYAPGEDPGETGWPHCRAPRVDRAEVTGEGIDLLLMMHSSFHYAGGDPSVEIRHRGIGGGWAIDTTADHSAPLICGLFLFCRYLEKENEFWIV